MASSVCKCVLSVHRIASCPVLKYTCNPIFVKQYSVQTVPSKLIEPLSCEGSESESRLGLVLGIYCEDQKKSTGVVLTPSADRYNTSVHGRLYDLVLKAGPIPGVGELRVLYDVDPQYQAVAVVGLGNHCQGYDSHEDIDEGKENIRIAAGVGVRALQSCEVQFISVESLGHAESAAEGAALGIWVFQEFRNKNEKIVIPNLGLYDDCDFAGWQIGLHKAEAQNLARHLAELPSNILTPKLFAQSAVDVLCKSNINVEVKVKAWCQCQKMGAFLAVSKGSCEPPLFLEISYSGTECEDRPIVLCGSGITFDSGGLCLRKPYDMKHMRGDMSGAANVIATTRAIANLRLPLNIRGLIPLCENMPGCDAMKPGDIITAMNGKKIIIQRSDAEGRLVLADTLYYAQKFWPRFILDVGTLTKDCQEALETAASGCFTNSDQLWETMRTAAAHTGDRMWRLPLWNVYSSMVRRTKSADLRNVGIGRGAGACRAAAFLKEFVPCGEWMHIDNYGVMVANGIEPPYLRKGMSGRPTRSLIEFISQLVCKPC